VRKIGNKKLRGKNKKEEIKEREGKFFFFKKKD